VAPHPGSAIVSEEVFEAAANSWGESSASSGTVEWSPVFAVGLWSAGTAAMLSRYAEVLCRRTGHGYYRCLD